MNKNNFEKTLTPRFIAATGVTAALFASLTFVTAPISFGPVQLRLAEALVLLVYIDPLYIPGILLGNAIANISSPFGIIDVFVGTLSTACASYAITKTKNLFIATLWPTFFCIFIGAEIWYVLKYPFFYAVLSVMAGEFAVLSIFGYSLFKMILKNKSLEQYLIIRK